MNAFLLVNVTFYNAVSMIHDVIRTADPFPYTVTFMFVSVGKNKTQQIKTLKDKTEYLYSVAVYQKYQTRLGEMIISSPRLENYQFSQPS